MISNSVSLVCEHLCSWHTYAFNCLMVLVLMRDNWYFKQTNKSPLALSPPIIAQGNNGESIYKFPFLRFNKSNCYFLFTLYEESEKHILSFDFYLHIHRRFVADAE